MQSYLITNFHICTKAINIPAELSIENISPEFSKALKKKRTKSILCSVPTPLCHLFHRRVSNSAEVAL